MFQGYSSNLTVAANAAFPFNNVTVDKGRAETLASPATVQLNQRGVYLVKVDGYATGAAEGENAVQLYVNGVAQPQAISALTLTTTGATNFQFCSLVQVATNNCPCNCISSPTLLQVLNGDVGVTDGHVNIIVTKLC